MSEDFLTRILTYKYKELKLKKKILPLRDLKRKSRKYNLHDFSRSIKNSSTKPALIAELKKASPSAGILRERFSPVSLAKIYQDSKASCLSVLTESRFFLGNLSYIPKIKEVTKLPVLRKDFILDAYQIYESFMAGADAILLIARILNGRKLCNLISLSKDLGLTAVVEIDSKKSLDGALKAKADVIGINNRNLKNFKLDFSVTKKLIPYIPNDKLIISESGISSHRDVSLLKSLNLDAVLIGEAFMRADNIRFKIKEIMGW